MGSDGESGMRVTPADARRRWFGVFFLIMAGGQLTWGLTVLKPHLKGLWFIGYWLACFVFTGLALLTAMLDLWVVRRRARRQQRELFERTMGDLGRSEGEEPRE